MAITELTAEVDGRRIHWLEAGAGWPLLLVHAFPLNADMWRPQLEAVADGWRFIAPNLRGFGESTGAADEAPPSMDDYASDLGCLLDHLEIDTAIIGGLSMGGYVTFALFRRSPERFSGMVLADTRAAADSPEGRAGRAKMRDLLADRGVEAVADQMLPKLLSLDADATLVRRTRDMIEVNPPRAIDWALAAMMERPDSTPLLASVSCPALVIAGERDAFVPPDEMAHMQRQIPRSRLAAIPGAGHLANLERPVEFSRALEDFLMAHL